MTYTDVNLIPIEQYAITKTGFGRTQKTYKWICAGYDIETTTQYQRDEKGRIIKAVSFPYIQQFSINDNDVLFSSYDDLLTLLYRIGKELDLKENEYTVIFIQNASFEFQFMRKYFDNNKYDLHITNVFAKTERKPLKIELSNNIIILDSMQITNSSLAKLSKDYCKTQKLVGDLDYSKQRHIGSVQYMSKDEIAYCINDVRILAEFSEYYYKTFLCNKKVGDNFLPLTSTSIVRHDLKQRYKSDQKHKEYKEAIKRCYPRDYNEYKCLMELFSGGYTHANVRHIGLLKKDVDSYDLKSSYPSILLSKYFPVSPFYTINSYGKINKVKTLEDIDPYLKNYCCWFRVVIKNVQPKTSHSIISSNKVGWYDRKSAILDNGRIRSCDRIVIDCTELDWEIYNQFYDFEFEQLIFFRIAKRGKLPIYFRETVAKYYKMKYDIGQELKKCKDRKKMDELNKSYANVKARLNSLFGCCCTRLVDTDTVYTTDGWESSPVDDMDKVVLYDKLRNSLLPQWAVWCTAWGRWKLLTMVAKLSMNGKDDCLYCDTDSTKIINGYSNRCLYDLYNAEQIKENREFIKELNLDYNIFFNVGTFEKENTEPYKHFKTMGAKRYVYEDDYGWHVTIAGLPKNALLNYCNENDLYVPDVFSKKMNIGELWSEKLVTVYSDEPQEIIIDDGKTVETHIVPSCVSLVPTTFNMTVTSQLLELAELLQRREELLLDMEGWE